MYAIPEDPVSADMYGSGCHDVCNSDLELCLPKLDENKKQGHVCVCTDNAIRDDAGNCVAVETVKEYVVDNCPSDTIRSPEKCSDPVEWELIKPVISLGNIILPDEDTTYTVTTNTPTTSPKPVDPAKSVMLGAGKNTITYKFTPTVVGEPFICQHQVTVIVHMCKSLDILTGKMWSKVQNQVKKEPSCQYPNNPNNPSYPRQAVSNDSLLGGMTHNDLYLGYI
jgi:hypothetical protein